MGKLAERKTRLADEMRSLRDDRREHLEEIRRGVQGLLNAAGSFLEGARAARARTGDEAQHTREEFREHLCSQVLHMRSDAQELLARYRRELSDGAAASRAGRGVFMQFLQASAGHLRDVAEELVHHIREDRAEMAEQTRAVLQTFVANLEAEVKDLCGAFSRARGAVPRTRGAAGARGKTVFASTAGLETGHEGGPRRRTPRQQRAVKKAPPSPADLSAIAGIGPAIQKHLNRQGIRTYAQLAGAEPQRLFAALKQVAAIAVTKEKVRRWIRDARRLVRQ